MPAVAEFWASTRSKLAGTSTCEISGSDQVLAGHISTKEKTTFSMICRHFEDDPTSDASWAVLTKFSQTSSGWTENRFWVTSMVAQTFWCKTYSFKCTFLNFDKTMTKHKTFNDHTCLGVLFSLVNSINESRTIWIDWSEMPTSTSFFNTLNIFRVTEAISSLVFGEHFGSSRPSPRSGH